MATWNVEGLSEIKVYELITYMSRCEIGVLCIQETHIAKTPYYKTDSGYMVILSGNR